MEPRISFVTLGVSDLGRSSRFYGEVLRLPVIKVTPSIALFDLGKTWLALYPRERLAEEAGVPSAGSGFSGFALSHNVRSEAEVRSLLAEVVAGGGGGRLVREAGPADWGGYAGYFADPDGFLWEVAWNPRFPHV